MKDHARRSSDITVCPFLPIEVSDLAEEAKQGNKELLPK